MSSSGIGRWLRVSAQVSSVPLLCLSLVLPATPARSAEAAPATAPSRSGAATNIVDLRPQLDRFGLSTRLQGDRGTCSVFTMLGAIEFAIAKAQGQTPRLSVEFLNWAANRACGESDDGAFFSDLWKGFAGHGVCAAELWTYQARFDTNLVPTPAAVSDAATRRGLGLALHWIKEWNVQTGLTEAELDGIRRTLQSGWPVCGGFRWPKEQRWVDDVLQIVPPDAVRDGHSVLLVGYRIDAAQPGGGLFLFRNSANGGRDGFMPFAYAQAYMNDAVWVESPAATATTSAKPTAP